MKGTVFYKELLEMKKEDIYRMLEEAREELRSLVFKGANRQLKNIKEIREIRRRVARILTVLRTK